MAAVNKSLLLFVLQVKHDMAWHCVEYGCADRVSYVCRAFPCLARPLADGWKRIITTKRGTSAQACHYFLPCWNLRSKVGIKEQKDQGWLKTYKLVNEHQLSIRLRRIVLYWLYRFFGWRWGLASFLSLSRLLLPQYRLHSSRWISAHNHGHCTMVCHVDFIYLKIFLSTKPFDAPFFPIVCSLHNGWGRRLDLTEFIIIFCSVSPSVDCLSTIFSFSSTILCIQFLLLPRPACLLLSISFVDVCGSLMQTKCIISILNLFNFVSRLFLFFYLLFSYIQKNLFIRPLDGANCAPGEIENSEWREFLYRIELDFLVLSPPLFPPPSSSLCKLYTNLPRKPASLALKPLASFTGSSCLIRMVGGLGPFTNRLVSTVRLRSFHRGSPVFLQKKTD